MAWSLIVYLARVGALHTKSTPVHDQLHLGAQSESKQCSFLSVMRLYTATLAFE
jgi:hypothetical protein